MTPTASSRSDFARIDSLGAAAFVAAMAPLFEGAPGFLWRFAAAHGRPFGSWERLFERARWLAHALPEPLQVDLVDAHPRLGARRETLSAMSAREQAIATPADVSEALASLNAGYEARFGFRYCVLVAGRPMAALLPDLELALTAARATELERGLDAVVDIARARHEAAREDAA